MLLRDAQLIEFTYDNLGRRTFTDAPGTALDVTSTYDLFSRPLTATQTGGALLFGYDQLSRLTSAGGPQGAVSSAKGYVIERQRRHDVDIGAAARYGRDPERLGAGIDIAGTELGGERDADAPVPLGGDLEIAAAYPAVQRQFSWPVGVNCGVRLRFSFPA